MRHKKISWERIRLNHSIIYYISLSASSQQYKAHIKWMKGSQWSHIHLYAPNILERDLLQPKDDVLTHFSIFLNNQICFCKNSTICPRKSTQYNNCLHENAHFSFFALHNLVYLKGKPYYKRFSIYVIKNVNYWDQKIFCSDSNQSYKIHCSLVEPFFARSSRVGQTRTISLLNMYLSVVFQSMMGLYLLVCF